MLSFKDAGSADLKEMKNKYKFDRVTLKRSLKDPDLYALEAQVLVAQEVLLGGQEYDLVAKEVVENNMGPRFFKANISKEGKWFVFTFRLEGPGDTVLQHAFLKLTGGYINLEGTEFLGSEKLFEMAKNYDALGNSELNRFFQDGYTYLQWQQFLTPNDRR